VIQAAELEKYRREFDDRAIIRTTIQFISEHSQEVIQDIIREKLHNSCFMGDEKIDEELKKQLEHLKKVSSTLTSEPNDKLQPGESYATYRIRSNPIWCNQIDQQVLEVALLLQKLVRFSHTKPD